MLELGTLGGASGSATEVNGVGQVVGYAEAAGGGNHAFSWTRTGGLVDLAPPGSVVSVASEVNDAGQVVGYAFKSLKPQVQRAFLWTQRSTTETSRCAPTRVVSGHSSSCAARVADVSAGAATPPGGAVSFSTGGAGRFSSPTCQLVPAGPRVASCAVDYTPSAATGGRSDAIAARYAGDATHSPSAATALVSVAP
jgi:probable HAF family extracellular repeat protein